MKREILPGPLAVLPVQPISLDVLREKYLKPGEKDELDLFRRVARALASVEAEHLRAEWEQRFFDNLQAGAIGAGRIMSAAGTSLQATLINCFVQPVGDCIQGQDEEGFPGIYEALKEAAETMRRGGGVGYDFSRIRPRGAEVSATASLASGPCSYIDVFDHSCSTVESAGARRGAQMGVLRIDHPDVLEFITAKRKQGRWNNFNVSVAVTDAFMKTLQADGDWELVHRARPGVGLVGEGAHQRTDGQWVYRSVKARELWDTVMKSAYDFAEPGILFVDTINRDNNLRYCELITATNPCVTADTWIATEEGLKQVGDLVGREFRAMIDGKAFELQSRGFFYTGRKPVVKLKTHEGFELRLTPNHLVARAGGGWVPAADLRPGEQIRLHDHRGGADAAVRRAHLAPNFSSASPVLAFGIAAGRHGVLATSEDAAVLLGLQRTFLSQGTFTIIRGTELLLDDREKFIATVASVQADGEADVYDVTVADVHAFDANGMYVHNCGEEPLPPYGCCDLGPVVLPRFVRHAFGAGGVPHFDFDAFKHAVAVQVRALDNVLDLTYWPLQQQHKESAAKRRIGVGFTGLGDTLVMLGLRYDSADGRALAARIGRCLRDTAYTASIELAKEKGAFPLLDVEAYLADGTFASRLDEPMKQAIREHGIRNSHLLAIAPTGTVSLAFADNASNGIEPAFSWTYRRKKREGDGTTTEYDVEDHAFRLYRHLGGDVANLPAAFVSALDMSAAGHLEMMEAMQPFIDTAISKTVNVAADYPYEDFKSLYLKAWHAGLKGLATYRPNDILGAVLEVPASASSAGSGTASAPAAHAADPMRSVIESRPHGQLPAVVEKIEYWTQQGQQRLYLVVSFLPLPDGRERAVEFFMPVGQSGESQQWITSSMRMLSLAARGGFLDRALTDMRKVAWDRGPVRLGTYARADGIAVPMWHDSEVAAIAYAIQNIIQRRGGEQVAALETPSVVTSHPQQMTGRKCPECGAHALIKKDSCDHCTECGYIGACG